MTLSRFLPIRDFSEFMLVAANAVPIVGVFLWGWSAFDTMVLYWLENVVIGIINILKILTLPVSFTAAPSAIPVKAKWSILGMFSVGRLFLASFFCLHYGMFMMVHGVLVFALFGKKSDPFMGGGFLPFKTISTLVQQAWSIEGLAWPIVGLVLSHAVSYVMNFWIKGERRTLTSQVLMNAPYSRMVVLHLTIIFGGWLVMLTGQPVWGLVLLMVIKTGLDLILHRRSHEAKAAPALDLPK